MDSRIQFRQCFLHNPPEHKKMIIVKTDYDNPITQENYDETVNSIDKEVIKCENCGHVGFSKHGSYKRHIKTKNNRISLYIIRFICPECGKTHAVLLSSIIPWSQISLKNTIEIIKLKTEKEFNKFLDEHISFFIEDIRNVRKRFKKYWKERIISSRIDLDETIFENCIHIFKRQFMQNKCTSLIFLGNCT